MTNSTYWHARLCIHARSELSPEELGIAKGEDPTIDFVSSDRC
jgi:hypothetical protein